MSKENELSDHDALRCATALAATIGRCAEAADILAAQAVEIERLTNELRIIANADVASWDDPSEFKAWAQNRACAAIAKETQ